MFMKLPYQALITHDELMPDLEPIQLVEPIPAVEPTPVMIQLCQFQLQLIWAWNKLQFQLQKKLEL